MNAAQQHLDLQRDATARVLRQYRHYRQVPGAPANAMQQVRNFWRDCRAELAAMGLPSTPVIDMCEQVAKAALQSIADRPVYWLRYQPARPCGHDDGTGWICTKYRGHITDHDVRPEFPSMAES